MNILFLNNYNYLRGGADNVFLEEARLLERHGHVSYAFCRQHSDNLPSRYDIYFPREMVTDSVKPTFSGLKSLLQLFYSKEAKRCLTELLRHIHVDVAHAHNIYGRLTTSVLDMLHEDNIPVTMTLHDYKLICPNYKLMYNGHICEDCKADKYHMAAWNRCHKDSLIASTIVSIEAYFNHFLNKYRKNVRLFISPSLFLKQKLIEFGWPENKIAYVPNFVTLSDFVPEYNPGKYFLYLGRLSSEKGILTLIEAFMKLPSNEVGLCIVGDGPLKSQLESKAAPDARIRFTGYLSGKALKEATQCALAVVVPSEWYENAPLSVLEALAFGKPVIGARIGGIPEMIEEGLDGYLFQSGNMEDLRTKLETFLKLPDSRIREMGQMARQKVERSYNPELHYEYLSDIYSKLM